MNSKLITIIITILFIFTSVNVVGITIKKTNIKKDSTIFSNLSGEKRRAVLVGVSDYANVNDLYYPTYDVRDIKNVLLENGWLKRDITVLTDSQATDANIRQALDDLEEVEQPGDISVFSFSGHGTRGIIRDSALCPHDCGIIGPYIYDTDLRDMLDSFDGKVVAILDSCYSGGMDAKEDLYDTDKNMEEFSDEFLNAFYDTFSIGSNTQNRVILMACGESEYSFESSQLGNGVFTYYIEKALSGKADGYTGYSHDDIITAEEAFNFAEQKTVAYFENSEYEQHPKKFDGDNSNEVAVTYIDGGPESELNIDFGIHRIKMYDEIEGSLHGDADWSYLISINNGNVWKEIKNDDYTTDLDDSNANGDSSKDLVYNFDLFTQTPDIKIKVWDRDPYIPFIDDNDLADVSSYSGGGADNDISDKRCAIYHGTYDIINDEFLLDSNSDEVEIKGQYFTTLGDGINNAKVWFSLQDSYNYDDYKPLISLNSNDFSFQDVEPDSTKNKTLTISNNAKVDSQGWASDLIWDLEVSAEDGGSWLKIDGSTTQSGRTQAQSSSNFNVEIDTTDLSRGSSHQGSITINSNDEYGNQQINIGVTLSIKKTRSVNYFMFPNFLKILEFLFPELLSF